MDLAAVNGPRAVRGLRPGRRDRRRFEARLAARGVVSNRLRTSHAFHSRLMDRCGGRVRGRGGRACRLSPPRIPFVSNVTGDWITDEEATSPAYWARQIRATVRFDDALTAVRDTGAVLLEVGPGQVLTRLARAAGADAVACLPTAAGRTSRNCCRPSANSGAKASTSTGRHSPAGSCRTARCCRPTRSNASAAGSTRRPSTPGPWAAAAARTGQSPAAENSTEGQTAAGETA